MEVPAPSLTARSRRWPMCPMPRRSFRIAAIRASRSIFEVRVTDMRDKGGFQVDLILPTQDQKYQRKWRYRNQYAKQISPKFVET